jgi:hypothetical protein
VLVSREGSAVSDPLGLSDREFAAKRAGVTDGVRIAPVTVSLAADAVGLSKAVVEVCRVIANAGYQGRIALELNPDDMLAFRHLITVDERFFEPLSGTSLAVTYMGVHIRPKF